jgi:hypothetical protein
MACLPSEDELGICEYHFARSGAVVPASYLVNDESMCAKCFAGASIHPFERIGDSDAELERDRKQRYFERNPEAKERKRLRDALWRARQKAITGGPCQQSVSA